jgi:hypothetical protein
MMIPGREFACRGCGREFVPARRHALAGGATSSGDSDAKYCSGAWKQRAYRERRDAAEVAAADLRLEHALRLRRRGDLDALAALTLVVAPSPELRALTRETVAA